ncbi:hypothetical protein JG688_00011077, partial [Phytophthora aleatoria]
PRCRSRPQAKRYAGGNGEGSRQEAPKSDEEGHRLQKKASQELAAAQRAADARTAREATKTAQASGEKARKEQKEQHRPKLDIERRRHARIPHTATETNQATPHRRRACAQRTSTRLQPRRPGITI